MQAVGVDLPAHRGRAAGAGRPRRSPSGARRGSAAHALGHVVVDAEEVDRRAITLEVAVADDVERAVAALEELDHVVRVRAAEHRVEEPAVDVAVQPRRPPPRRRRVATPRDRREVERDADRASGRPPRAQRLDREPVREQQVVRDAQRRRPVADARAPCALGVPEEGDHPRLVVGDPLRHDVAEPVGHQRRVLGEALGGVARRPAARGPAAPAAGPSGRASRPARSRARAGPRRAGGRTRRRAGSARRGRRAARAATRSRSGSSRARARPSGRGPRASGGSGRRRRRRCRRPRPRPAGGRSGPRSTRRARPRRTRPRSGRRRSRAPQSRSHVERVIPSPPPRSGPARASAGWRRTRASPGASRRRLLP